MTENAKNYWEAYLEASARTVPADLPWLVYHTEEKAVDSREYAVFASAYSSQFSAVRASEESRRCAEIASIFASARLVGA